MASSQEATVPLPARPKRIVFFHPDLGIGGAERLIVDAAVGLQEQGNKVTIFTSHCDPNHCFEEARDGTLDVRVRGNTLFPPTFLNRFHILLAILRQIHLVLSIAIWSNELSTIKPDVFVVDQLSACVPLLRWLYPHRQRTLFYCHFPDQLLADRRTSGLLGLAKRIYRFPFDWLEGWSMSASDRIVVNSEFTKSVASRVWPSLAESLGVIYPCVSNGEKEEDGRTDEKPLWDKQFKVLLSINRFERKKDIGLAIRAYHKLPPAALRGTRLIIAGGYDQRVSENVEYHRELVDLAEGLGLSTATAKTVPTALGIPSSIQVLFMLSVPGFFKETLLNTARLLLYTPSNEHFGIVPVEAMHHGVPVLASNSGGPLETIVEDETGWLRDASKVEEWTAVINKVLHELSPPDLQMIGRNGRERVREHFTRSTMAGKFDDEMTVMLKSKRSTFLERKDIVLAVWLTAACAAAILATVIKAKYGRGDRRASEFARARRMNPDADQQLQFFHNRGQ
ncbi:alpha-1,3/alpha-1,6-mannosyltransferase [Cladophialophora psammophila CBS 110553]|uniref:Alpha-1,3/1,6-mannosyltransferase ALG2 n=1 Tax=Cladophialophora psammophila CBS 110553 TaxID=1182543 RepID=W9XE41_9EURO|nr:alpha-1,3/alpha-1,6-mannosyltransferase [Cladophialophora psammophila CBS 110553]EXJ75236.1 alpha-1,3/alpha-1,6-mannosyltransferase [Cladophialophora psammophila CBS 110553]